MALESSRNLGAFREFEHDGWETVSVGYERHFARLTSQTVPAILDAAHVAEGMRVLDVSTGPGMLAGAAVKRGAQVVALDFSGKLIEIARRNVSQQFVGVLLSIGCITARDLFPQTPSNAIGL